MSTGLLANAAPAGDQSLAGLIPFTVPLGTGYGQFSAIRGWPLPRQRRIYHRRPAHSRISEASFSGLRTTVSSLAFSLTMGVSGGILAKARQSRAIGLSAPLQYSQFRSSRAVNGNGTSPRVHGRRVLRKTTLGILGPRVWDCCGQPTRADQMIDIRPSRIAAMSFKSLCINCIF